MTALASQPQAQRSAEAGLQSPEMTWGRIVWRRFRRNRLALAGLAVLALLVFAAVFAPWLAPHDRDKPDLKAIRKPPSAAHWLGTDDIGRDNFTRLLFGGRVSLTVGVSAVAIYIVLGALLGAVAGFFGGWVDTAIMRLADIVIAFPFLMLSLTIVALVGPRIENVILAIGLLGWPEPARLVRGEFLSLRERDFVEAARGTGANPGRIIFRHMLPNAIGPLIVSATLGIGFAILTEAALSYLGFGVREPIPSWGSMLREGAGITELKNNKWLWLPPGTAIFCAVLAINFLGDGLRDALDPRLKQ